MEDLENRNSRREHPKRALLVSRAMARRRSTEMTGGIANQSGAAWPTDCYRGLVRTRRNRTCAHWSGKSDFVTQLDHSTINFAVMHNGIPIAYRCGNLRPLPLRAAH